MAAFTWTDVHTHAFHPKIAARVCRQLEEHYQIKPVGTGLWEDLQPRLAKCGISRAFVHSAATAPAQVIPANRWACSLLKNPGLVPFGTLHPDYDNNEKEMTYLWEKGVRGIKLHPDFQGFRLDDPGLLPILAAMEGQFVLMVHVGDRLPPAQSPSCPWKIAAIKKRFPRLQMIVAHLGGYLHWQYVIEALAGLDVFLDTSSSLFAIPPELLKEIFASFPRANFLFGSDYPLWDPLQEMTVLQQKLKLSDQEIDEIMTNAAQLGL